jgi:arylsulfatase A-like enzyme/Flp pilus assembly protein TadD
MTGTYPRVNGVQVNGGSRVGEDVWTLAELLHEAGYATGAFVSSVVLDSTYGLDRGFDVYDDELAGEPDSARFEVERSGERTVSAALSWLAERDEGPFFAWVHLFDPHTPYRPPAEYAARFDDPYDGEIAYTDDQLARLLDWLESTGRRERTAVVVVGDHGEGFGEHGEADHGLFVYGATIRVPLIVDTPGLTTRGRVVPEHVQVIDVYPTILDLAGLPEEAGIQGVNLSPALDGATIEHPAVYGESRYGQIGYGWAPLRYLIDGRWKFIEAPEQELYDLEADPGELENLIAREPDEALSLRVRLLRLERQLVPRRAEETDLDGNALAQLQALGYVGGVSAATTDLYKTDDSLRDPKAMLEVFQGHSRAHAMIKRGQVAEGAALLESLLARSPESIDMFEDLGRAYLALGRYREAQAAYERSLSRVPDHPERLWGLAEAMRHQQRYEEAIETYNLALERRPSLGEAHLGLTLVYAAMGRWQEAYDHSRRQAEINPASVVALDNLAQSAIRLGRFDEAVEVADRLIELDASNRRGHDARWQALAAAGRRDEAIDALRESLASFPDDWNMTTSLAWLLAVTEGQSPAAIDEAVRLAEHAAREQPDRPRSFDVLAVAYAARGDYAEAVEAGRRALGLMGAGGAVRGRPAVEGRVRLFEEGRPYLE